MRSPRCAPLLLLLLLPPLLLTPPAGDAAVITGVSGPGAPVCPAARPLRPGRWARGREGHGRVAPGGDTCLSRLLAHLQERAAPKAADGPGRKRDPSVTPPLSSPPLPLASPLSPYSLSPWVWSLFLLSREKFSFRVFSSAFSTF